jgi:hypothetical protein
LLVFSNCMVTLINLSVFFPACHFTPACRAV